MHTMKSSANCFFQQLGGRRRLRQTTKCNVVLDWILEQKDEISGNTGKGPIKFAAQLTLSRCSLLNFGKYTVDI